MEKLVDKSTKPHYMLDDWCLVYGECNRYTPPEAIKRYAIGKVDGVTTHTSNIIKIDSNTVETQNSIYVLREPDIAYVKWCIENNQYVPTRECPIQTL